MPECLPIVISQHHGSYHLGEFADDIALSREQVIRNADYGNELAAPSDTGDARGTRYLFHTHHATHARAVVDLNRNKSHPHVIAAQPNPDAYFKQFPGLQIWKPGRFPTTAVRERIMTTIYDPYRTGILNDIRAAREPTIFVAFDNCAGGELYQQDSGTPKMMPAFILSNNGEPGKSGMGPENADRKTIIDPETQVSKDILTSCDPRYLAELQREFAHSLKRFGWDGPDEIELNTFIKAPHGELANLGLTFNNRNNPDYIGTSYDVGAFQLEFNTDMIVNPQTLEHDMGRIVLLRAAFGDALRNAHANTRTVNVNVAI